MMDGELFSSMEVHPLAAIFPMLSDDELADLAADIKANGLLHPIVRTVDGRTVVDGRNRLAACRIAEVAPLFDDRIRNDDEARALIVSANLQRRNMTKSQQAMALAMLYPDPAKLRRKGSGLLETEELKFSAARLSQARSVRRAAPDDLAPLVLAGTLSLDAALAEIQQRLEDANSDAARMERLREHAPDLAELVADDRMKTSEAIAALNQRIADAKEIEANQREALIRATDHAYHGILSWANLDFVQSVTARINDPAFRAAFDLRAGVDPQQLDNIITGAKQLTQFLRRLYR